MPAAACPRVGPVKTAALTGVSQLGRQPKYRPHPSAPSLPQLAPQPIPVLLPDLLHCHRSLQHGRRVGMWLGRGESGPPQQHCVLLQLLLQRSQPLYWWLCGERMRPGGAPPPLVPRPVPCITGHHDLQSPSDLTTLYVMQNMTPKTRC